VLGLIRNVAGDAGQVGQRPQPERENEIGSERLCREAERGEDPVEWLGHRAEEVGQDMKMAGWRPGDPQQQRFEHPYPQEQHQRGQECWSIARLH